MAKDIALYLDAVQSRHLPAAVGETTAAIWHRFAEVEPGVDFTRVYTFTASEDQR
jgi:3-hydroxyisobutyrate dehydrogenase